MERERIVLAEGIDGKIIEVPVQVPDGVQSHNTQSMAAPAQTEKVNIIINGMVIDIVDEGEAFARCREAYTSWDWD